MILSGKRSFDVYLDRRISSQLTGCEIVLTRLRRVPVSAAAGRLFYSLDFMSDNLYHYRTYIYISKNLQFICTLNLLVEDGPIPCFVKYMITRDYLFNVGIPSRNRSRKVLARLHVI